VNLAKTEFGSNWQKLNLAQHSLGLAEWDMTQSKFPTSRPSAKCPKDGRLNHVTASKHRHKA